MKNKKLRIIAYLVIMTLLLMVGVSMSYKETVNKDIDISSDSEFCDVIDLHYQTLHLANIRRENEEIEYNQYLAQLEEERIREEQEKLRLELEEVQRKEGVNFNVNDLRVKSNINAQEMHDILPATMKHLASAIVYSEQLYNVNAFFIASLVAYESGWATSARANNGSNNLTGMAVYSPNSRGMYFESQQECVIYTANHLSNNYLSPDGSYFSGYSIYGVNVRYAANKNWASNIATIMHQLLNTYKK